MKIQKTTKVKNEPLAIRQITSEAWVLKKGTGSASTGELNKKLISFSDISDDEVLVEPLYGCWEGNMHHALSRDPIDICVQRDEDQVVLGNAGVVRVLRKGKKVDTCEVGDCCIVFCNTVFDSFGYPIKIYAYDAAGTIGLLSKQTKINKAGLIPIPTNSGYSLKQWAAFSLRYITAWANWKVSYKCWRSQMSEANVNESYVMAWGGGVSFAQVTLARNFGFNVAMITSKESRIKLLRENGVFPLDRTAFKALNFIPEKYAADPQFKSEYRKAESVFLKTVTDWTEGKGVSIFVENLGVAVHRATLKAMGRQSVITTSGWKEGMELTCFRAMESINRHIHVHTHYANMAEGKEAIEYAIKNDWMPPIVDERVYQWDEITELSDDYANGRINSFFPIYAINPE